MKSLQEIVSVQKTGVVSPGQDYHFTSANTVWDTHWQGDLEICITEETVPMDYAEVLNPTEADRQLAVEFGEGSHHRLKHLRGVRLFRPRNWGEDPADLRGPYLILAEPNAIQHERSFMPHGTLFVDAPMTLICHYQRNMTSEGLTRRALD